MESKDESLNLDSLPEFEPPPELWGNILGAKLAEERRRFKWQAGAMLCVTAVMAVALLRVSQPTVEPPTLVGSPVIDGTLESGQLHAVIEESRRLEAALSELPQQGLPGWQSKAIRLNRMRVGLIDQQIARAYQEGMGAKAIEDLWKQRTQNMRQILETYDQAHLMTRI